MARIDVERAAQRAQQLARDVASHPKVAAGINKVGLEKFTEEVLGQATTPQTFEDPNQDTASESNVNFDSAVARPLRLVRIWTLATSTTLLLCTVFSIALTGVCAARFCKQRSSNAGVSIQFGALTLTVAMIIFSGLMAVCCAISLAVLIRRRAKLDQSKPTTMTDVQRSLRAFMLFGLLQFVLILPLGSATYAVVRAVLDDNSNNFYSYGSANPDDFHPLEALMHRETILFGFSLVFLMLSLIFAALGMRQARLAGAPPMSSTTTAAGGAEQDVESEAEKQSVYQVPTNEVAYTGQPQPAIATPAPVQHVDEHVAYQPPQPLPQPPPQPVPMQQPVWSVTATPPTITQAAAVPPPRAAPLDAPTMSPRPNNPLLNSVV